MWYWLLTDDYSFFSCPKLKILKLLNLSVREHLGKYYQVSTFLQNVFSSVIYFLIFLREVYLGRKVNNNDVIYAIKVMKKSEMIHKNMACQGEEISLYFVLFFRRAVIEIYYLFLRNCCSCDRKKCPSTVQKSILRAVILFFANTYSNFFGK